MKQFVKVIMLATLGFAIISPSWALTQDELKTKLTEVLGGKESWAPSIANKLKRDMSCDQVKAVLPTLPGCNANEEFDFQDVPVTENEIVSSLELTFESGKLADVKVKFKTNLDKDQFKAASLELFEAKWGSVKPEKRENDILTAIGPSFIKAQRTFIGGQWAIAVGLPKTE